MQRMWTRIASICVLSFIASCGGGGGGGQEPRPNFERVTIAGVPGVKDNRTGLVWASQLGKINAQGSRLPDAVELLDLVDRFEYEASASQKTEMSQFFGFALTENDRPIKSRQSFEAPANVDLVVIVGEASEDDPLPRGFAYLEANPPVQTWYVLSGGLQVSGLSSEVRTGLIIQSDKMWKACPEGMVLAGTSCTDAAKRYSDVNEARAAVIEANQAPDRIYSDWRLPSKQELSSLLDLKSTGPVFIQQPFKSRVSEIRLPFLTVTDCSKPGLCMSPWVVRFQFDVGPDSFVRQRLDNEQFHLLLVRDAR